MKEYLSPLLPVAMSVISAVVTVLFVAGRNVEKLRSLEAISDHLAETIDQQSQVVAQLLERVAMLEGQMNRPPAH